MASVLGGRCHLYGGIKCPYAGGLMKAPYVGPSPFSAEQTLFGRDADIKQLQWRLISDRIIVLYSPSGAGKTSLLMAKNGLLSTLTTRFHVLPVQRITQADDTDPVASLLQRTEQGRFGSIRPNDTLLTYFNRITLPESDPPKRLLLVLDQFEEVLTCNVTPERQSLFPAVERTAVKRRKNHLASHQHARRILLPA